MTKNHLIFTQLLLLPLEFTAELSVTCDFVSASLHDNPSQI